MSLRVKFEGLREFQDALKTAQERLHIDVDRLMEEAAKDVYTSARSRVHVITGRLRESIRWIREGPLVFRVKAVAPYAVFEEARGGTHRFMSPSVDAARSKLKRVVGRLLSSR